MPISPGATVHLKFTTRNASGVPTTLGGSPVVSIYKDVSTTESVAGVTLTVDFDARTGLNHVAINTAADGTFYASGSTFNLVITTGTVGGVSVVGEVVGTFDLSAAVSIPTAAQVAAAVCDEINTGATHNLPNSLGKQVRTAAGGSTSAIYTATAPSQAGMTTTQLKLDAGASSVSQVYRYNVLSILSGTDAGDSAIIIDYNGSTKIATVDEAWAVQPDATSVFEITPGAKALVIDKTGFSLAATGLDLLPAGALNGKGDWLTAAGYTPPPSTGAIATAILTTQMIEAYNADGVAPTLAQAMFLVMQRLTDFAMVGSLISVHKLDGTTVAFQLTLDSATAPTSSTRSS